MNTNTQTPPPQPTLAEIIDRMAKQLDAIDREIEKIITALKCSE
jgi:hypothetical protein